MQNVGRNIIVIKDDAAGKHNNRLPQSDKRQSELVGCEVTGNTFSLPELISMIFEPTTMASIIQPTGMTKLTVHSVIHLLIDMVFLERAMLKTGFIEGHNLVGSAYKMLRLSSPRIIQHTTLKGLAERVGEACNYGVLSGGAVIFLDLVEGRWLFGPRFNVGSRVPIHSTAIGQVLLSRLEDNVLTARIHAISRPSYTTYRLIDPDALIATVQETRKIGIGKNYQKFMHGAVCVVVPVEEKNSQCFGGPAMYDPEDRFN